MSDVDLSEFFRLSRPKRKPCAVGHALKQLKPAERTQLAAALGTDQGIITNAAVVKWLEGRKFPATVSGVVNHRKNQCACHDA